jgi:hypothetical protein
MLTYEASAQIIKKFPWLAERERDLESCIAGEAEYWQGLAPAHGGTKKLHDAVDKAHDLIVEWLEQAYEFQVDVDDPEDLSKFVASHRRACVWTVLVARHSRTG